MRRVAIICYQGETYATIKFDRLLESGRVAGIGCAVRVLAPISVQSSLDKSTTEEEDIHGELANRHVNKGTGDVNRERRTFVLRDMSNAITEAAKQRPRPRRITGDTPTLIRGTILGNER